MPELNLEAIERRWDRVLARKEGRQQGEVGLVAMISAADVPDLLIHIKDLKVELDRYRKALERIYSGTRPGGERSMSSIEIAALALHGGNAPVDAPATALWGKGCPVTVWDGPYSMRCGLGGDRGTCGTHGEFAKEPKALDGAASVASADTTGVDHG